MMWRQRQHDLIGIDDADTIEGAEPAAALTPGQDGDIADEELSLVGSEDL
jgi:hypothetical protein